MNDAYIVAALKNEPALQLTFSTFNDTMTLSLFGNYSAKNKVLISKIVDSCRKTIAEVEKSMIEG